MHTASDYRTPLKFLICILIGMEPRESGIFRSALTFAGFGWRGMFFFLIQAFVGMVFFSVGRNLLLVLISLEVQGKG